MSKRAVSNFNDSLENNFDCMYFQFLFINEIPKAIPKYSI